MVAPTNDTVSPWVPMSDPRDVKCLTKSGEETNELGSALMRCLMQGIDETEPTTGKSNREWLEDEIADVTAQISILVERFGLVIDAGRVSRKMELQLRWLRM